MIYKTKKIQKALLKSLIASDFIFIQDIQFFITTFVDNQILLKQHKAAQLLLFDLLKSLKQFLRLLQFISKIKESNLYFSLGNIFRLELLQSLFLHTSVKQNYFLSLEIPHFVTRLSNLKFLFHLNDTTFENKNLFKILTIRQFFLNQKINLNLRKRDFNSYKIYNDLNDFKKIIFVGLFIAKILKN